MKVFVIFVLLACILQITSSFIFRNEKSHALMKRQVPVDSVSADNSVSTENDPNDDKSVPDKTSEEDVKALKSRAKRQAVKSSESAGADDNSVESPENTKA